MLTLEYMPLEAIKAHPKNPKLHAIDKIEQSMQTFGYTAPILIDETSGLMVAGHGRLDTLQRLRESGADAPANILVDDEGLWHVPVIRGLHFESEAEMTAYLLADNKLTEEGGWQEDLLAAMIEMIHDADPDLVGATGFSEREMSQLLDSMRDSSGAADSGEEATETEPERLLVKWQVQSGQLWRIPTKHGEHRVICGDSTHAGSVERLMDGELADCMWTDPPYGVSYEGGTGDKLTIENDSAEGLPLLLNDAFKMADEFALKPGAFIYIAHPAGRMHIVFDEAVVNTGWTFRQGLVWVKSSLVLGHSDYHYQHEPIIYAQKPGDGRFGRGSVGWYGDNAQTSVFAFDTPNANRYHPTMKPVGLVAAMIVNSAPVGGIVYEPFGGSGSTLVAAEQTGRVARVVELDPKYVAVVLERAEQVGLKPELVS